jgi:serine/threonine protein kinase
MASVLLPSFKVDEQVCIVMDFYKQGDLWHAILDHGPQPFEEARLYGWITSGLVGLGVIHSSGVVHRDLKPANLLLSDDRQSVVIADFGLAKHCDHTIRTGQTSDRAGTPLYMAPELLRGQLMGKCVDVWSMGVVLLELMTLEHPSSAYLPWCIEHNAQVSEG